MKGKGRADWKKKRGHLKWCGLSSRESALRMRGSEWSYAFSGVARVSPTLSPLSNQERAGLAVRGHEDIEIDLPPFVLSLIIISLPSLE